MNGNRCHREDELLDSLGRGYLGADLKEHVDACTSCAEIHMVAGALLDERVQAVAEAPVPSAGTMLWRMQMRHRHDAQVAARRSLFVGQAVTLLVAIVLVVALVGASFAGGVREVYTAIRVHTPLWALLGAWLLMAPIGGWVAIRQK
jgi:hypothetical protein